MVNRGEARAEKPFSTSTLPRRRYIQRPQYTRHSDVHCFGFHRLNFDEVYSHALCSIKQTTLRRVGPPFPPSSQLLSLPSGILISRRFRVDRNSHSLSRAQHTFNSSVSDWLLGFVAEHLVTRYPGSVLRGARTSRRPNTGRISATPQPNDNRASLPRNAFKWMCLSAID